MILTLRVTYIKMEKWSGEGGMEALQAILAHLGACKYT